MPALRATARFLALLAAPAACQTSTAIVTATTTITATESGAAGPCANFNGACVVYGAPGAVPYTTTVYAGGASPPPTTTTTSVKTFTYVPQESSATSACQHFDGACVVYGTDTRGSAMYTTTLYGGGNTGGSSSSVGNADGYIGVKGSGDGFIGAAVRNNVGWPMRLGGMAVLHVGMVLCM